MQVAVLISGRGSNLEALIKHQDNYQICHVISNNPKAKGLEVAQINGITNTFIDWSDKQRAELELQKLLHEIKADLVVLAGFMRILSNETIDAAGQIINIHPSLLPKYPGLHTHEKVLFNKDQWHGATVHVVNDQLDSGLILAQIRLAVELSLDADALAQQLISKEHKLLTTVVGLIAKKHLYWQDGDLFMYDKKTNKPLLIDDV
ncbi:phosphoribosylglycinamide formyltransferase [Marinicella sp. S1101]|uniref:phosphoribosylglycinamide formyltransferase n=1 Tax=Marinicella marina TaxID=2996016 RepID=UPI002260AA53|nr:phosphoribosylglycinamide formyltransferase [Marinicella marina]MCX7554998.1 phosphoribosylglycinamide formyltransferase [Marinicella marina]MDJ1141338.1 phosphoribosylglycinamide formyltransferase [Marinicella marina]